MGIVKRVTNLGKGMWKTRTTRVADRMEVLEEELARMAAGEQRAPAPSLREERAVQAPARTPVEELARLEGLRRDGLIDEEDYRRQRDAVVARAVGDEPDEPDEAAPKKPGKTL